MPQAVVRPSLAIKERENDASPNWRLCRRLRWSIRPRSIEGDTNCGKSQTVAAVNRRKCAGCDSCALRTSEPSDRPIAAAAVQAVPFHARQRSPHSSWFRDFKKKWFVRFQRFRGQ